MSPPVSGSAPPTHCHLLLSSGVKVIIVLQQENLES
jgi:hypothetical protein